MKAVILGAGRIGRGFVTELLVKNQVSVTFFDASDDMVAALSRQGEYTIHVLGHEDLNTKITDVAIYSIQDTKQLAEKWAEADYIFTAVGGKNMPAIGANLAEAFTQIVAAGKIRTSNIVTCENWVDPALQLKEALLSNLTPENQKLFLEYTGVSESVVMATGTGAPDSSQLMNPMDTWVQNMWSLPVDKDRIKGELPDWECITFVDAFGDLLKQKLYTNNTSVALIAYLGSLKGLTYVAESANDPEVEPILIECYKEINEALVKGMGINEESQLKFSATAKAKYQDREIIDVLTRIARDPIRKLAPTDRLVGPAQIALGAGVKPTAIALAIAAAIYYENPEDEMAVKLQEKRKSEGVAAIIRDICKLKEDEPLTQMIYDSIANLKNRGWIKED